jgi:hypothetical protein
MRSPCRKLLALGLITGATLLAGTNQFKIDTQDKTGWTKLLAAAQMLPAENNSAEPAVVVVAGGSSISDATLSAASVVIIEGAGEGTEALGFKKHDTTVNVRQIRDQHAPDLPIVWENPVTLPVVDVPKDFQIFASERWKAVPLLAGKRTQHGAILWVATTIGDEGFERFPYLLQALADLGLEFPVRASNLWAFFDGAYRSRADVDYLASRWRAAGVAALHVAAWHNMEPDADNDRYLANLIAACHRNAIVVYAWLELPHVSERFWTEHPAWREKTAVGQDAQLDWRKLMNLQNAECRKAVAQLVGSVLVRFDWDGVNLSELYFESLEGSSNPARFTPMNDDVRMDFKRKAGFDPKSLFDPASAHASTSNDLRRFLEYRAGLAAHMQSDWLDELQVVKKESKPYLDIVLTHIDDRFEPGTRDLLGADVARSLPALQAHNASLLVEDPANLWSLGPERYKKLAGKYRDLNVPVEYAVDLNIVERYQDVYPTKKQTGGELFELIHEAAMGFSHVALYFENSLEKQDLPLLSVAAAKASVQRAAPDDLLVNAKESTKVNWQGAVELDGKPWPVRSKQSVVIPAGKHQLTSGVTDPPILVSDFNGNILSATTTPNEVTIAYKNRSRAVAKLSSTITSAQVDGVPVLRPSQPSENSSSELLLPPGQHVLTLVH